MAESYKISDKKLGRGTFGDVYLATHKKTGEKVAIKKCEVRRDSHGVIALREIKNFQHIALHKHIVHMIDYSYEDGAFWLIMDYCDRGDLEDYMKKYAPNTDKQLKIMHQCASAVSHMHSLKVPIIHRDIKPSNILFRTEGKSVVAKVADFGLSKILDDIDSASKARMGTVLGTEGFMAPELFARKKYNHTVDIFALGMVFLSMVNFKPSDERLIPLSATYLQNPGEALKFVGQEMYEAALSKSKQPVVISISPLDGAKIKSLKKLITDMSVFDPDKRISMTDVLREIEKVAVGQSTKGMVTGKAAVSEMFKSNLDITQTRGRFDPMSSIGGSGSRGEGSVGGARSGGRSSSSDGDGALDKTLVVKKKEEACTDEDEDEVPDVGYILMRKMIEEHVQKKQEGESKKKKEKEKTGIGRLEQAIPLLRLLKLLDSDSDKSDKFEVGERVVVEGDIKRAKEKQHNHGGWHEKMDRYLGKAGTVKQVRLGNTVAEVQFADGQKIHWNISLLEPAYDHPSGKEAEAPLKTSPFKMNDVVRIKVNAKELETLQRTGNAGWKDRMKKAIGLQGVVHKIHFDGDVLVEFMNHDKWWMNPKAIEVVDMSDKEIEAGDQVIIIDDKKKVQQLQKGHGEWIDPMIKCLGRSGIVRKVASNDRTVVEVADTKYIWNLQCLKLIIKSEDMLLMILARRLFDS